jgi:hypothetical protein
MSILSKEIFYSGIPLVSVSQPANIKSYHNNIQWLTGEGFHEDRSRGKGWRWKDSRCRWSGMVICPKGIFDDRC